MPITLNKPIITKEDGSRPMDEKDAFKRKLEGELNRWKAEIDKMEAKAAASSAEANAKFQEELQRLRDKQIEAEKRLRDFNESQTLAWEDMRDGLEKAWEELGKSVKSAIDRFNK